MEQVQINNMVKNAIELLDSHDPEDIINANQIYKDVDAPLNPADTDDILKIFGDMQIISTDVAMQFLEAFYDGTKLGASHDEYSSKIMFTTNRHAYNLDLAAHCNVNDRLSGRIFWDTNNALFDDVPAPLSSHDMEGRLKTYLVQHS